MGYITNMTKTPTEYGFHVRYTSFNGNVTDATVTGFCSPIEARDKCLSLCPDWTPPKWWQWWRSDDTPRRADEPYSL